MPWLVLLSNCDACIDIQLLMLAACTQITRPCAEGQRWLSSKLLTLVAAACINWGSWFRKVFLNLPALIESIDSGKCSLTCLQTNPHISMLRHSHTAVVAQLVGAYLMDLHTDRMRAHFYAWCAIVCPMSKVLKPCWIIPQCEKYLVRYQMFGEIAYRNANDLHPVKSVRYNRESVCTVTCEPKN